MKFDIITLFPNMFSGPFAESMMKRAVEKKSIEINLHNLRDWALDSYGTVDDKPFGGGVGMLIRPEPVFNALETIKEQNPSVTGVTSPSPLRGICGLDKGEKNNLSKVIMMSARGIRFTQEKAEEYSKLDNLVILCGHYEGFDQRVSDYMIDEEISIGDYVLTGGEIPAMVIVDSVARLIPGVLGKDESSQIESFSEIEIDGKKVRTIEYPQYTRPREFMGHAVPEVLVSGDPKKIREWQENEVRKELRQSLSDQNQSK